MKGKFLVIGILLTIGYFIYRYLISPEYAATKATTNQDAAKNLNIMNPNETGGQIIQTNTGRATNWITNGVYPAQTVDPIVGKTSQQVESAPAPSLVMVPLPKSLITNDNSIYPIIPYRQDAITPEELVRGRMVPDDLGVDVVGSRYGQNLPDNQLLIDVGQPLMQTAPQVPIAARTTDNFAPAPASTVSTGSGNSSIDISAKASSYNYAAMETQAANITG